MANRTGIVHEHFLYLITLADLGLYSEKKRGGGESFLDP